MTARKKVHAEACASATATTVAGPRQFCSASIYDGADLRHLSNRPGAYDAMALPSRGISRERTLVKPESGFIAAVAHPKPIIEVAAA